MNQDKYLTVSALNKYITYKLEHDIHLKSIFIKGEISNFRSSGGHHYFVLKDDESEISAVMFSNSNKNLKFIPTDGMTVLIFGTIQTYLKKGVYNINVFQMEETGLGDLHQQYLKLKEKLEKEGLFKLEYKKPIPKFSEKIGVITSATGDALHDIVSTITRRFPLATVYLYPALVQGVDAPRSLRQALYLANMQKQVDVLIIGRGGGSVEDLSCFNDEMLARDIFHSEIPIISGVGHEADFTICDFVADFRAPTPTGAAVAATPDKEKMLEELKIWNTRMESFIKNILKNKYYDYTNQIEKYYFKHFDELLEQKMKDLDRIITKLNVHGPINSILRSIEQVEYYHHRLKMISLDKKIDEKNIYIHQLMQRMTEYLWSTQEKHDEKVDQYINRLIVSNPLNLMKKGYTLTYQEDTLIYSVSGLEKTKPLKVKFFDGSVEAQIIDFKKE